MLEGSSISLRHLNNNILHLAAVIGGLAAATLLLNFAVLAGNWRWDDSAILLHLHQYSILDDFINPGIWQQFSPANLTPWLIFSFEIDLILFGVRPELFYLHQLVALAAVAVTLYFCLGLWISRKFAVFGAFLFLLGTPSLLVVQQLMTRHYVEGLIFCLLSLICFVLFLRQSRPMLLLLSSLFYIAAITAKETYVPLLLLLPFLPESKLELRLKALLPMVIIAGVYTLWRGYMLGAYTGGYVASIDYLSASFIKDVMASFSSFPRLLFGRFWFAFVFIYILLIGSYAVVCRSRLTTSVVAALLTLIPLIPLVRYPGILVADRYLFLLWLLLSFSVAFYSDRLVANFAEQQRPALLRLAYLPVALLLLISLPYALQVRQAVANSAKEFDVQAEFIWQNDDRLAFIPSAALLPSFWFVTDLAEFKSRVSPGATSPLPLVDEVYLGGKVSRLLQYERDCSCMREVEGGIAERLSSFQDRLRPDAPLFLRYEYQQGYFSWEFGPYDSGTYHVVSDVIGVIPAPRSGRLRVTLQENAPFYLRYTSPEDWLTYSELQYIHHNSESSSWHRD